MGWEKLNIFTFSDKKFMWSFVIAAVLLYTPLLILNEWPQRDTVFRYAPMAEAFARGDFQYAFHPRCQMMLPLCAGIICTLTGVSGLMACKISALIFFIVAALPLFSLAKPIFGRKIAIGAVILYLFCFHIIEEMVVTGVRDTLKIFFLLWMSKEFLTVFRERDSWSCYLRLGAACGLSICVRGEMLFIAVPILFLCGVLDGMRHRWLRRFAACLSCAVAGASVEILINLAVSGYAVPSGRFVPLFQGLFHTDPTLGNFYLYAVLPTIPIYLAACHITVFMLRDPLRKKLLAAIAVLSAVAVAVYIIKVTPLNPDHGISHFLRSIHNGCAPVFYPPALLGVLAILWQRRWDAAQGWILTLFLLFDLLVIGQIIFHDHCYYVSSRYLLPAVPLFLPWSAVGIATLWALLKYDNRIPFARTIATGAVIFAIGLSIYLSYRTELLNRRRPREVSDWQTIQDLKRQLPAKDKYFYKPPMDVLYYRSNTGPVVFSYRIGYYSVAAYLAGCSETNDPGEADFIITSASIGARGMRKKFKINRPIRKIGKPIPSRRGKLVILKIVK